ncbi:hypothetical protein ACJX0J_036973, partial [Zea mays]
VEPAELSLDLAKMSREIRGSPEILFAREVARACRMRNFISFFRLARKATYLQACLMHAHFAKLRRQALASLHSGLQNGQGIPISQYEELYLVKEGPFLNSESDFPSGCSQLVHSKKSQRVVDDVSSGLDCAPTSKEKTVFPYTGQPNAPAIPPDGRMDLDPSFPGPISITPDRQISPLFSDPFSPRAASKLFSSTHPKPLSPTDGRKDRFSSVLTAVSPRTGKRDILSKTPKVASPKAEGKTKLVNGLIAEDQDSGVAEIPQKVEMQTDILWSQANTQNTNALAEPIVSHPLADRMSLNYSSMYGAEDDFRAHVSSIGADMDEGTPPDHECLVIGAGLPISSPLSYHEEYEDNSISNGTNDDWLPIVMPAKKLISNENLKAILSRTSNERIYAEMFLPSIGWSLPSRIQPLLAAINSCKIPEFSYDLSWLNHGSHMG